MDGDGEAGVSRYTYANELRHLRGTYWTEIHQIFTQCSEIMRRC